MDNSFRFDTELFINEVRRHPFLYDVLNEKYKDATLKKERWMSIATKFCITKNRAHIKWKSIRDRFMREKKAYIVRQQRERDCPPPKWRLYHVLQSFLDNAELQSSTGPDASANGADNSQTSALMFESEESGTGMNCFTSAEDTEEYIQQPCDPVQNHSPIATLVYAASPSSAAGIHAERASAADVNSASMDCKRIREDEVDAQITSLLTMASNNLGQLMNATQADQVLRDDTYFYFLYLMERFRKLNPQQQRQARRKIDQTFYDFEDAQT